MFNNRDKSRVVVALSGGVDSAMAAALLVEAGYEVIGVTMRLWAKGNGSLPSHQRTCCSVEAVDDARRVCQLLGISFYFLNFESLFKRYVVDYFCQEYQRARTPNPCLACNQHLKFDFLLKKALALGADYLATGHYARVKPPEDNGEKGEYRLLKAVDPAKDQSYALYTLEQKELKHLLLPLGWYRKSEVRRMAAERGLPVANKEDSQEICFIPDGDYRGFLAERLSLYPGPIVDTEGRFLSTHPGLAFYTVGQRQGLGLTSRERLYVLRMEPDSNTLVVGPEEELFAEVLLTREVKFVSAEKPHLPLAIEAKIRYNSPEANAILLSNGKGLRVRFEQPQRAITPGQAVVFYQGETVLGGGIIEGPSS